MLDRWETPDALWKELQMLWFHFFLSFLLYLFGCYLLPLNLELPLKTHVGICIPYLIATNDSELPIPIQPSPNRGLGDLSFNGGLCRFEWQYQYRKPAHETMFVTMERINQEPVFWKTTKSEVTWWPLCFPVLNSLLTSLDSLNFWPRSRVFPMKIMRHMWYHVTISSETRSKQKASKNNSLAQWSQKIVDLHALQLQNPRQRPQV